ncbi:MAG: YhdP family protein [Alphaproteobacteria bacterium]
MTENQNNRNPDQDIDLQGAPLAVSDPARMQSWLVRALLWTWRRLVSCLCELTAIILGIAFLWFYVMNVFLGQKTTDVSFAQHNVGLWFSDAFDGQSADIGQMEVIWQPETNEIILEVKEIVVKDKFRGPLQKVDRLQAAFDFDDAVIGRFTPKRLDITGGSVTWLKEADGQVTAGLGTPQSVGVFGELSSDAAETGSVNKLTAPKSFDMQGLKSAHIREADVYIVDKQRGLDLQLRKTNLKLENARENFTVQAFAQLGEGAGTMDAKASFSPDYEDFDLVLNASSFNPSLFAPNTGELAQLKKLNLPLTFTLDVAARRGIGLERAALDLQSAAGTAQFGTIVNQIKSLSLSTQYDTETGTLNLHNFNLDGSVLKASGGAKLTNIGRPATGFFKENVGFDANFSDVELTLEEGYDVPVSLNGIAFDGRVNLVEKTLSFNEMRLKFDAYEIITKAVLSGGPQGTLIALSGNGRVEGVMSPKQLLSMWPTDFSMGARRWIDRSILSADISDIAFDLNFPEAALSGAGLKDEDLNLTFKVSNGVVKYISTMTPYRDVTAFGELRGNSFDIKANTGRVGDLAISRGHVSIPRLKPKGGDLIIKATAAGGVQDMLSLIDQEPLQFAQSYELNIETFKGQGAVDLMVTRPLLENYDRDRIAYTVEGMFDGVTIPYSMGEYGLKNGEFKLFADRTRMSLSGPVDLGPWRTNLDWRDQFQDESSEATYSLSGPMTRETLDGFGLGFREYFDGVIDVEIDASGRGLSLSGAKLTADMTKADIRASNYWGKAKGVKGTLEGTLSRSDDGSVKVEDLKIEAPGLAVVGFAVFQPDMGLSKLQMDTIMVDGFADGAVTIMPNEGRSAFVINMTGKYLDISSFISQAISVRESGVSLPMVLEASIDRLMLDEMFVLRGASFEMDHDGAGTKRSVLKGTMRKGAFRAEISPNPETSGRVLTLDVPDASLAAMAFLNMNNIKGGRLQLTTQMPNAGDEGPMQGDLLIDDVVVVQAPILAKMLSLASLTGLADAMVGGGLKFEQVQIPFSYEDGRLSVRDATASGPALGLTGNGEVDITDKLLDVDGVLVPAYSANSTLASIPILGNIFAGKKGEGIFALNYAVRGPFSASQVSVNPLSALTPGFLRGIFQPRRDGLPEMPSAAPADAASEAEAEVAPETEEPVPPIPD